MKTDQQQGTHHHEISEQVRTRGDPTTCKEKWGYISRLGISVTSHYHHQKVEGNRTMTSKFLRRNNFTPAKTFSDICILKILPPKWPFFRKLPDDLAHLMRVQVNWKELVYKQQERGKGNLQDKKSQDDHDSTGIKNNWSNRRSESAGNDVFRTMNLGEHQMRLVHLKYTRENLMDLIYLKSNLDNQEKLMG